MSIQKSIYHFYSGDDTWLVCWRKKKKKQICALMFVCLFVCFWTSVESGCSNPAEPLPHAQVQPVVGCDWTGGSGKGRISSNSPRYFTPGKLEWEIFPGRLCTLFKVSPFFPLLAVTSVQSSLLSTILGELPSDKGVLEVKGQLTYAAQQPWVFPGTIRSNILFGKELDPKKYERVIKACALKRVRGHWMATSDYMKHTEYLLK